MVKMWSFTGAAPATAAAAAAATAATNHATRYSLVHGINWSSPGWSRFRCVAIEDKEDRKI